jgi:hypothetical protein
MREHIARANIRRSPRTEAAIAASTTAIASPTILTRQTVLASGD